MVDRDDIDADLRDIDEDILDLLAEGRCTRRHLADQLGVTGEYVYQRVHYLVQFGLVRVIHDGFYELPSSGEDERVVLDVGEEERPHEPRAPAHEGVDSDESVDEIVARVSENWGDTGERLEQRRAAARVVLQYAVDTGEAVGRSDATDRFFSDYRVNGQDDETWWRKNIRPVLSEVGEYNKGLHGYQVELSKGGEHE